MNLSLELVGVGILLVLAQVVAALPWLAVFNWDAVTQAVRDPAGAKLVRRVGIAGGVLLAAGIATPLLLGFVSDPTGLEWLGRIYAAVLNLQLCLDVVLLALAALLFAWPKGGAVALAAFQEGVRQPMFWLLLGFGLLMLVFSPYIPYFTFGEDYKMVQELGYDTIMLAGVLFGVMAASMSISEEIEGRTAITLMSKPVSRRQFLLGKFAGTFLAAIVMTLFLGWVFQWILLYKHWYDRMDPVPDPTTLTLWLGQWSPEGEAREFIRGVGLWLFEAFDILPGLVLGLCKVMVLLAIAVSLATRLPMVANLVTCLVVYLLGHLTPVLVHIAQHRFPDISASTVGQMLIFMAQLFEALLPGMDLFGVGTAIVSDVPPETGPYLIYVGGVVLYGVLYTAIVLFFGLILFEDRDLA